MEQEAGTGPLGKLLKLGNRTQNLCPPLLKQNLMVDVEFLGAVEYNSISYTEMREFMHYESL